MTIHRAALLPVLRCDTEQCVSVYRQPPRAPARFGVLDGRELRDAAAMDGWNPVRPGQRVDQCPHCRAGNGPVLTERPTNEPVGPLYVLGEVNTSTREVEVWLTGTDVIVDKDDAVGLAVGHNGVLAAGGITHLRCAVFELREVTS
jgi:hypothetical protein